MTLLTCPDCGGTQEVVVTVDTYSVRCEYCGNEFDIPRKYRKNKREVKEYTSRVNIRVGYLNRDEMLDVAWTVQSAEKHNQYLEREAVSDEITGHPPKTYWYVALFKMLPHVGEYKSARIWVKHNTVVEHLAGEFTTAPDDPRTPLVTSITDLCGTKCFGYEFGTTDSVGQDIKSMLA
jgi:hypothetical protein